VQQVCERFSVPLDAGVARLQAAGIEATAGTMIRELATARGKTPSTSRESLPATMAPCRRREAMR